MMTSSFYLLPFRHFDPFFPMQFLHYSNCFFALIFKAKSKRFLLNYLAVATFFSTLKCTRRDLGHRE